MSDIEKIAQPLHHSGGEALQMSYDASLSSDIAEFQGLMEASRLTSEDKVSNSAARTVVEPLAAMNAEAKELAEFASNALSSGDEMTPSEIISLTVKSQEFMFHSQLTANIANRTADGVQQLFKQQG